MNAAAPKSGPAPQALHARERLIVALDLPDVATAEAMVAQIGDAASFYKIGYQLGYAGGLAFAQRLLAEGKQVFLDLKLHDIGNTVAHGVESIAKLGATFLTVHAYPQTMRAALSGRGGAPLRLLAVTVLTSYNEADLVEAGYSGSVAALVEKRAAQARDIGLDGIVCAPDEAEPLRRLVGPAMALVTPGVRPTGSDAGDQKRFTTPARAIQAGADHIVVGRPITGAADPRAAAAAIVAEIAAAAS